jgi:hypothetical protein
VFDHHHLLSRSISLELIIFLMLSLHIIIIEVLSISASHFLLFLSGLSLNLLGTSEVHVCVRVVNVVSCRGVLLLFHYADELLLNLSDIVVDIFDLTPQAINTA